MMMMMSIEIFISEQLSFSFRNIFSCESHTFIILEILAEYYFEILVWMLLGAMVYQLFCLLKRDALGLFKDFLS